MLASITTRRPREVGRTRSIKMNRAGDPTTVEINAPRLIIEYTPAKEKSNLFRVYSYHGVIAYLTR